MKIIPETTVDGVRVPQRSTPKDPTEFTDSEKDVVALDTSLQLIIVDSMDSDMCHQILNCTSAKHMWDTVELIMEGTEEVKENRLDILTSQYEAFKSLPAETITQVFERYNRLLNELSIHGKNYPLRETNMKFMLTLPHHVEHRVSSIRERDDFNTMSLEKLYGKLKTYEMEQEQRVIIYGQGTVDSKNAALQKTTALVAEETKALPAKVETAVTGREMIIEAEIATGDQAGNDDDYYTMEELDQLEDESMAYLAGRFKHIKFRRNPKYKMRSQGSRFQKGGSFSGSSSRGGYKTNMVDRSKFRCYNCNELGHFSTECKKPKQARDKKVSFEKKGSYEELKRENEKLKQKLDALMAKHQGRAYIAEGKSWDDSESDDEEVYVNFALMADSSEASPQSSQVSFMTSIDMSLSEYKHIVDDLNLEIFNIHTSMLAAEEENARLVLKIKKLESKNEELELVVVAIENLRQLNEYLENKVKVDKEVEDALVAKVSGLEVKLQAYKNSANIAKGIIDSQSIDKKTAIGYDYSAKKKNKNTAIFFETTSSVKENVPHILKDVDNPLFKKADSEPLNEQSLLIKQEMLVEDLIREEESQEASNVNVPSAELPRVSVKIENPITESGNSKGKNRGNRNGKVGVTKENVKTPSSKSPRKVCNNCNSVGHLTHACKQVKVESTVPSVPNMPAMNSSHTPCGDTACMPCAMNIMSAYFNLMNASASSSCIKSETSMINKHTKAKTASSSKTKKKTHISKPSVSPDKAKHVETSSVNDELKAVKKESITTPVKNSKTPGPKLVWVPKKP